ncbi:MULTISPECIES: transporter substrate-binding domain-containing protein [unclassified Pseudodesulfovibrio]|uniref:transporter substrate-binding domain-containing protein n=1 Tax=unclassified Pseudodesulfovibrio TaxID=2661612 RepID=UPI0013E3D1A9|nr:MULTISPECIES: transporter substrate-binding domain-containing protein [unclassified Pseudodesulfovibrio]MCJ2163422.1 transporter substrate-binding domain-containing protein [Pseudodesulfovibrio sp. S3-i]
MLLRHNYIQALAALLFGAIILATTWTVSVAATSGVTPSSTPPRTIKIGGDINYPPFEFLGEDGMPTGFNVEITRAIAKAMNCNIQISLGLWKGMRQALESGEIDMIQGISYSPRRAQRMVFSNPYTTVEYAIFSRQNTPVALQLADLQGKSVLVEDGGVMFDFISRNYPDIRLVPTYSHENALRLLSTGMGDYALVSRKAGIYITRLHDIDKIYSVGTAFSLQKYCYAALPQNRDLIQIFNTGLEKIKATGEYSRICARWLNIPGKAEIPWKRVTIYGVIIITPLLAIMVLALFWNKTLQAQVDERTKTLREEVKLHQRAKQELRDKQKQIIQADRMATLGLMASGIAHEVNTPNGLFLLNLPILQDVWEDVRQLLNEHVAKKEDVMLGGLSFSNTQDEITQLITDMRVGAERIKSIVMELKDYGRQDPHLSKKPLDMNKVVAAAVRLLKPTLNKSTRHFNLQIHDPLPQITANEQKLQQIIVNLIMNACQALPDPGRAITVTTGIDEKLNAVIVEVKDEGVGIQPEDMDKITTPFFTTKRNNGGTGLGLAVSTAIAKEHYGIIDFESTPGKGTTAILAIPLES